MSNKQTADHINTFFSSIASDFEFPEIREEWLAYGESDPLPLITEENVAKKLKVLRACLYERRDGTFTGTGRCPGSRHLYVSIVFI